MNPIEYKITLDCRRAESQVIITAKQGEASGRKITFSLNEGRLPYKVPSGVTAVFRAKKPSGAVLYNTCTVTADGNVEYIITTQTVAEVGKLPCELQLSQDGKVIFSPNFTLLVYKNLSVDSEVESSDEFTALQAAISRAENLTDGTTFTPTVSEDGVLSWTNDGGKANPDPVNIKGPAGADGAAGEDGHTPVRGTDYWTADDIAAIQSYIDAAAGDGVVIEGTASGDMSEVTITTPDAWTLVSEAWNSEKRPLVVLRLSDDLCAYLTSVSTMTADGQSQGMALFSLPPVRHLGSTPPYSIWLDESGGAAILPVESINGADGIGIQSVEQTATSTEDGGTNIITVTKTDGTSSTFTVRNGSKGSTGADGKSAYQYAQESGYTGTETEFAEKLAQEQLDGTTLTLTPTQVYDAVSVGIPVTVHYFDGTYGSISFTVFNAKSSNVVVSQRIISANGEYILAELIGNKPNGTWNFVTTTLAEKTDIPSLEGYATEAYVQNYHDNTKQDIITDLATIRSGASKGATAVQPEAGKGLFSGSYNDLTDKPTIPAEVTPLTGTIRTLTPTQVYDAVSAGVPVKVQHTDGTYGLLSFTAFNIAESLSMIVSQAIVYYNSVYILAELGGNIQAGNWFTKFTVLAEKSDIPTIPTSLKNPNALTIKIGSTTVTYDGSTAQTVTIDDGTEVSY